MKKAKITLCMLLALILMFSLFACGKSSQSTSGASTPPALPSASAAAGSAPAGTAASAAASSAPAVKKPSSITIGVSDWLGRFLDAGSPATSVHACDAVYDTLFLIDPNTKQPISKIISDWKYTDDKTFVMTLKPGITFSNGDKATADDLLFSITNHFDRKDSDVSGLGPLDIPNCTSDGKNTVTLKFTAPYGPGIYQTTLYLFDKAWCQKVGWDSQDWYNNPNGTGPYKVTEYVTDDHMTLQLKDNYWNAANEKFDVQKWTIKFYPDASTMYMALEKGDISLCSIPNVSDYQRWKSQGSKDIQMDIKNMGDDMLFMMGMTNNKIFENKSVREALAYGVDWASIGKLVMGELYVPATSSLVADSPYYKNVGAYEFNVDKAKKVLKDAGIKNGDISIHIYDMTSDYRKNLNEAFQAYCQALGIKVDLEFGDVSSGLTKWMKDGGSDAGWMANIYGTLTREPNVSWSGLYIKGFTWELCSDKTFTDKAIQALNTVDQTQRKALYQDLQQYAHDNFIMFPVYEDVTVVGYRKDVFTEDMIKNNVYTASYFALHGLGQVAK